MTTLSPIRVIEIRLDDEGRLLVLPDLSTVPSPLLDGFPFVYRAALAIWDENNNAFRSQKPEPNGWSYGDWFRQIVRVTSEELGVRLSIDSGTQWSVSPAVRQQIQPNTI